MRNFPFIRLHACREISTIIFETCTLTCMLIFFITFINQLINRSKERNKYVEKTYNIFKPIDLFIY